jgi:hypothetical protein
MRLFSADPYRVVDGAAEFSQGKWFRQAEFLPFLQKLLSPFVDHPTKREMP